MNKNKNGKLLNIAHRGARSVAPENTLVAGRKACQEEADFWEFDVRLTGDGKLVVLHDETLTRTTDVCEVFPDKDNYRVSSFDLPEIRLLDAGSWFVESDPFGEVSRGTVPRSDLKLYSGVKVPSLREALELTKDLDWRANIELKFSKGQEAKILEERTTCVLRQLVDLVEELGVLNKVVVSSFNHRTIRELKNLHSEIKGVLLVKEPLANPIEYLKKHNAKILNLKESAVQTEAGLSNIKEVGRASSEYEVNLWTVNKKEKMRKYLVNPFIGGLITDYPGRLSEVISESA